MNSLTIVVEGQSDELLLRRLLGGKKAIPLRFYRAAGRSSLATLGRNILVHEGAPVLVVMDADTLDPKQAEDACRMLEVTLRRFSADDQSAAFAFVPELEVVFFEAPSVLVRRFGPEIVSQSTIDRGLLQPHGTVQAILRSAGIRKEAYFKELSGEDIDELRQGKQASRLIEVVEGLTVGVGR